MRKWIGAMLIAVITTLAGCGGGGNGGSGIGLGPGWGGGGGGGSGGGGAGPQKIIRLSVAQTLTPFVSTSRSGQPLPTLGLSRVTVLTGPDTCSASESVVNSLRGVGVTVNLVGGTTCGKPYGFYPQDNCGTTYFAIQFKGVNQQGYGDYGDGMAPNAGCVVADDFNHQLGDKAEARLAAALALRSSGSCSVSAKTTVQGLEKAAEPEAEQPYLPGRSPLRENRLIGLPDPA